jgi:hypothetical protein
MRCGVWYRVAVSGILIKETKGLRSGSSEMLRTALPRRSTVTAGEQILSASLERLGTWHDEPEGISQPTDRVEREADGERILDLLPRDTGCKHRAHLDFIDRVLARELAQHAQRCAQGFVDGRGLEIGEGRRDLRSITKCPFQDSTVLYCGGQAYASQEQSLNYWSAANRCSTTDTRAPLCDAQGITSVAEKDASGCAQGTEVKFYKLLGGEHDWYTVPMNAPGNSPFNPNFDARSGVTTDDIVWNFFATHPKQ